MTSYLLPSSSGSASSMSSVQFAACGIAIQVCSAVCIVLSWENNAAFGRGDVIELQQIGPKNCLCRAYARRWRRVKGLFHRYAMRHRREVTEVIESPLLLIGTLAE